MIILEGKYNRAKVFTDNIERKAISQIIELCNQSFAKDSKIRIMPDVHAGKGCTVGTTMTIQNKVVPSLVGVDIGCGVDAVILNEKELNLKALDAVVREFIPSGFDIREKEHKYAEKINFSDLRCKNYININRARLSVASLGGGNHYCECNKDSKGNIYLVVHSGSRYLGKQVAEHYQEIAYRELASLKEKKQELIKHLKHQNREKEIQKELKKLQPAKIKKDLAYLEGKHFEDYINDMKIVQTYAAYNRKAIIGEIVEKMNLTVVDHISTIHNYIDTEDMILRKGAVSAQKEERLIVPINMRDGSIIAIGKGNKDWNYSAPHGAGRLMSRSVAKQVINLEDFMETMKGIYSTSVNESTIDEAPFAYKPIEEIIENTKDTIEIVEIIRPIYNFKSSKKLNCNLNHVANYPPLNP